MHQCVLFFITGADQVDEMLICDQDQAGQRVMDVLNKSPNKWTIAECKRYLEAHSVPCLGCTEVPQNVEALCGVQTKGE